MRTHSEKIQAEFRVKDSHVDVSFGSIIRYNNSWGIYLNGGRAILLSNPVPDCASIITIPRDVLIKELEVGWATPGSNKQKTPYFLFNLRKL